MQLAEALLRVPDTETAIAPETRQAYLEMHYSVFGKFPLTLEVGIANPDLAMRYKALKVQSCAFITACNPLGQSLDAAVNAELQAAFAGELCQRSLVFVEGLGQHPTGQWPGEASFLVWDLSLEAAKALGTQNEQNAIIWCGLNAVPKFIVLR